MREKSARLEHNKLNCAGDREPLINFAGGETLKELLRLIASACKSRLLIADSMPAMSGPESVAKAMSRRFNSEISPLVKSFSGFAA